MTEDDLKDLLRRLLRDRDHTLRHPPLGKRRETREAADASLITQVVNAVAAHTAAQVAEAVKHANAVSFAEHASVEREIRRQRDDLRADRDRLAGELDAARYSFGERLADLADGHAERVRELATELAEANERAATAERLLAQEHELTELALTAATSAPAAPGVPARGARSAADGTESPGEGPAKAALPRRRKTPLKAPDGKQAAHE
jgi:hypothetical protein